MVVVTLLRVPRFKAQLHSWFQLESGCGPATHVQDLDGALDSPPWAGPSLAVGECLGGMNQVRGQWRGCVCVCISVSLPSKLSK